MSNSTRSDVPLTIYVSLAMNQVEFFYELGCNARLKGERDAHICFHEGGCEWLAARSAWVFNPYNYAANPAPFSDYGIEDPLALLVHERAAYEQADLNVLLKKLKSSLGAMVPIFDEIIRQHSGPIRVVQELGGFLTVLAVFYEAKRRKINNYFLEPSFFRRRFLVVKNSLKALQIPGPVSTAVLPEVQSYIENTIKNQALVVPQKDRFHYRNPLHKLVDARNWKRLIQKIVDKYLFSRKEEFSYLSGHVSRHLRMFLNYFRLRRHYQAIPVGRKFIYYPFHVPADVALTLRSPEYLNQIGLIDEISRLIPQDWVVAIKEHPALVGAVSATLIRELLKKRSNVVILDPGINNFAVMQSAEVVLTVNSKAGTEALMLRKPVVVLGDAFYKSCSLVTPVEAIAELSELILTSKYNRSFQERDIYCYLQDIWYASLPGEIYDTSSDNIKQFSNALNQSNFPFSVI